MMIRQNRPDPRFVNILLDANALDRFDQEQSLLVDRFKVQCEKLYLSILMPKIVLDEIEHPNTPSQVERDMIGQHTLAVGLNAIEVSSRAKLVQLLRGNGQTPKHDADADHLFEASKYGGYFITHDLRILNRQSEISEIVGTELSIVTLKDFIIICESL